MKPGNSGGGKAAERDGARMRASLEQSARNEMVTQDQRRSEATCRHGMVIVGSRMRKRRESGSGRGRHSLDQVKALGCRCGTDLALITTKCSISRFDLC
jgi:hypothetical protein